jgi:hypothetical protein
MTTDNTNNLTSAIDHSDIDAILDAVPRISVTALKQKQKPKRRTSDPDLVLNVFLDWQKGRRSRWSERRELGLTAKQIGERYGISELTVHRIGQRQIKWDVIRPQVAQLLALGQAPYLLAPMLTR